MRRLPPRSKNAGAFLNHEKYIHRRYDYVHKTHYGTPLSYQPGQSALPGTPVLEDVDYGCEERPDVSERQVIMLLKTDDNQILQMRQPDFLMAQRKIQEGDSVCLIGGFLQKPIVSPCTIQYYETEIPVKEYVKDYVDIPTFLSACKTCPNYGTVWSCPPYSFDVSDFWMKYQTLKLYSSKIIFPESALLQTYRPEEIRQILDTCLFPEKQRLSDRMMELEKQYPGSVSLSAGACSSCPEGCSEQTGSPAVFLTPCGILSNLWAEMWD